MAPTYDTHCPVCREAITMTLEPSEDTVCGWWLTNDDHRCVSDPASMEAFGEFCDALEDHPPAWWERAFERQQLQRNVASGLQGALL